MPSVRTAKELMRAGELYPGDDPELNRELDERQAMVSALNALPYERSAERAAALTELLSARTPSSGRPSTATSATGSGSAPAPSSTSTARCSTGRRSPSATSARSH